MILSDGALEILKYKAYMKKFDPGFLKENIEDTIYALTGGDFTKYEEAKNLKVSQAAILFLSKSQAGFLQWYQSEKVKSIK